MGTELRCVGNGDSTMTTLSGVGGSENEKGRKMSGLCRAGLQEVCLVAEHLLFNGFKGCQSHVTSDTAIPASPHMSSYLASATWVPHR